MTILGKISTTYANRKTLRHHRHEHSKAMRKAAEVVNLPRRMFVSRSVQISAVVYLLNNLDPTHRFEKPELLINNKVDWDPKEFAQGLTYRFAGPGRHRVGAVGHQFRQYTKSYKRFVKYDAKVSKIKKKYKKLLREFQWAESKGPIMVADEEELRFLHDKILNKGFEVSQISISTSADQEFLRDLAKVFGFNVVGPAGASDAVGAGDD